jgi:aldehyde:ferredoxin oxidoreductase
VDPKAVVLGGTAITFELPRSLGQLSLSCMGMDAELRFLDILARFGLRIRDIVSVFEHLLSGVRSVKLRPDDPEGTTPKTTSLADFLTLVSEKLAQREEFASDLADAVALICEHNGRPDLNAEKLRQNLPTAAMFKILMGAAEVQEVQATFRGLVEGLNPAPPAG